MDDTISGFLCSFKLTPIRRTSFRVMLVPLTFDLLTQKWKHELRAPLERTKP